MVSALRVAAIIRFIAFGSRVFSATSCLMKGGMSTCKPAEIAEPPPVCRGNGEERSGWADQAQGAGWRVGRGRERPAVPDLGHLGWPHVDGREIGQRLG